MHRSPFRAIVVVGLSLSALGLADLPRVNVRDFGAQADCRRVADGAMNKGSTTFTSTLAFCRRLASVPGERMLANTR